MRNLIITTTKFSLSLQNMKIENYANSVYLLGRYDGHKLLERYNVIGNELAA